MDTILTPEIQSGLDQARIAGMKRLSRYRVEVGEDRYKVLRMWDSGFSVAASDTPILRGLVDIYDGPEHLFQCLIVATGEEDAGELRFDFKRATPVSTDAALDYERGPDAPVALIARDSWS